MWRVLGHVVVGNADLPRMSTALLFQTNDTNFQARASPLCRPSPVQPHHTPGVSARARLPKPSHPHPASWTAHWSSQDPGVHVSWGPRGVSPRTGHQEFLRRSRRKERESSDAVALRQPCPAVPRAEGLPIPAVTFHLQHSAQILPCGASPSLTARCPSPQHARSALIIDNRRSFSCIPLRGSRASSLTPLAVIISSRSYATRPLPSARARIHSPVEMARGDSAGGGFLYSRCPGRASCTPLNCTRFFFLTPLTAHHLALLRPILRPRARFPGPLEMARGESPGGCSLSCTTHDGSRAPAITARQLPLPRPYLAATTALHQPSRPAQSDRFCFQIPGRQQTDSFCFVPGICKQEPSL